MIRFLNIFLIITLILCQTDCFAQNQKSGIFNFIGCSSYTPPSGNVCTTLVSLGILASCTESVSSITNSDTSIIVSPTTGGVVVGVNWADLPLQPTSAINWQTGPGNTAGYVWTSTGTGANWQLGGSASMIYPSGSGITQVSSGTSWGTTLSEVNGDIIYGASGAWTVQAPPTWNQNTTGQAGTVATISGLITNGANITISGSGTSGSPYSIASSGGGGGSNYWILNGGVGNVGISTTGSGGNTVGIGTTLGSNYLSVVGGNVGIGTWNAVEPLEVNGQGQFDNTLTTKGIANGTNSITNSQGYTQSGSATNAFTGSTQFGSSAQGTIDINGNLDTSGKGQFGGGTGSSSEFSVQGNAAFGSFYSGTAPTNGIAVSGNVGIGTAAAPNNLYVAGTAVIQSNVGIGSGSPGQILDVQGNIRSSTLTASNPVITASDKSLTNGTYKGNTTVFQMNNGTLTSGNITKADANQNIVDGGVAASSISTQTFGTLTNTDWCNTNGTSISCTQAIPQVNLSLTAGTYVNGDWCTYTSSGTVLNCNTAVPVTSLTGDSLLIGNSSSTGAVTLTDKAQTANTVIGATSTTLSALTMPSCPSGSLAWTSGTGFSCVTGGSNYWLNDTGNVGINTTYNVGIGTVSQINVLNIVGNIGIGTGINDNYLKTTAPVGGMIVEGNVGIGTYAPAGSLVVIGGNIGVGSNNPGYSIDTAGGIRAFGSGNSYLNITTTGAPSGNVGIGTNFPSSNLSVGGNVTIGPIYTNGISAPLNGLLVQGNVGIGSSSPGQLLDVMGTFRLTGIGHISSNGVAPTVASNACGSTAQGTIVAKSTDISGTVTVGTLTVTSCAITFHSPWQNAPVCVANDDTNVLAIRPTETTTGITFTSLSSASGDNISWICVGNE